MGSFPAPEFNWDGIPDLVPDDEDDEEETESEFMLEEGDRVFYTQLLPEPAEIHASSNFSQRLAEAHCRNSDPKESAIPSQYADFAEVFSEKAFEALPQPKEWDHAVELVLYAKLSNCKVYPLSLDEQAQLDVFLTENLASGRIRPSKSPMASPCFFIKKKDGTLRLIQDYRAINAITVKNGTRCH